MQAKNKYPKFLFLWESYVESPVHSVAKVNSPLCVLLFCSSTVSTKISGTITVPLSSVELPAITLRVAHSI